jgi:uncharacterized protein (DUF362 family)
MNEITVALQKIKNLLGSPVEFPDSDIPIVQRAIAELLDLIDYPPEEFKDKTVLILPNLVRPDPQKIPASYTDPRIIIGMIRFLKSSGAFRIQIGTNPGFCFPARKAFDAAKLTDPIIAEGAEMICFDEADWEEVPNPGGRLYRSVKYAKSVLNADIFINLPKWKTHMLTNVSLSIKNLLGCIHDDQRMLFHRNDIIHKIVDLSMVRTPDINILDGLWAMEGQAPFHGEAITDFNALAASRDLTALDCSAAQIMGFNLTEVPHLMLAKQRLWNGEDRSIRFKGDDLSDFIGDLNARFYPVPASLNLSSALSAGFATGASPLFGIVWTKCNLNKLMMISPQLQ